MVKSGINPEISNFWEYENKISVYLWNPKWIWLFQHSARWPFLGSWARNRKKIHHWRGCMQKPGSFSFCLCLFYAVSWSGVSLPSVNLEETRRSLSNNILSQGTVVSVFNPRIRTTGMVQILGSTRKNTSPQLNFSSSHPQRRFGFFNNWTMPGWCWRWTFLEK